MKKGRYNDTISMHFPTIIRGGLVDPPYIKYFLLVYLRRFSGGTKVPLLVKKGRFSGPH